MQPGKNSPILYVFFGLIASGKSTLAEHFARQFDFSYYNTDRVRKELAGIALSSRQEDQFNQGIYSREFSRKTYQAMLDGASADIGSGSNGVVLDGSYSTIDERSRVLELTNVLDVRCVFVLCTCSEEIVKERLEVRARDPLAVSDGRWEIYLVQKERFQPPSELESGDLVKVNTEQPVETLVENLATTLKIL